MYLDGQQQHAMRPVHPDYAHGLYIRAYNSMFAGTGKLCKDEGLYISRENVIEVDRDRNVVFDFGV